MANHEVKESQLAKTLRITLRKIVKGRSVSIKENKRKKSSLKYYAD